MKNFKFLAFMLGLFFITSCSGKKEANDELSGHLLMGPYSVTALTGSQVSQSLKSLEEIPEESWLPAYNQLFGHPYKPNMAQPAQQVLLNDYNIVDKESTAKGIEALLKESKETDHKAFAYARAVNVANFAYAAGYITLDEAENYEQEVLKETRTNYSDWETYLKDFLEGREKAHGADNPKAQELFNVVVNDILLEFKTSPYKQYNL